MFLFSKFKKFCVIISVNKDFPLSFYDGLVNCVSACGSGIPCECCVQISAAPIPAYGLKKQQRMTRVLGLLQSSGRPEGSS